MPACIHRILCQLPQGFIRRLGVKIPPVLVIRIDVLRKAQRCLRIIRDQQSDCFRPALDTPGGIDTGTELKHQVIHCYRLAFDSRYPHDSLQTDRREGIDGTQAVESQNPVLSSHRHDIAGNRHSQQRKQLIDLLHIQSAPLGVCLHKLEPYAAAAQFLIGIQAVLALHIQHRHRTRRHFTRRMVVADDKVNSQAVSILHLIHRLNAAIQRYHQRTALRLRGIDTLGGYTVPLRITVRDIIDEVIRLGLQKRVHQRHRRCAVHIIIAVHHDPLMRIDCAAQPVHRSAHITHQEGIMQAVQRRTYIRPRFSSRTDSPTG